MRPEKGLVWAEDQARTEENTMTGNTAVRNAEVIRTEDRAMIDEYPCTENSPDHICQ
jgi:hypothetical protein